jgi:uncharacterized protein
MSNRNRIDELFPRGLLRPELYIGVLSSVAAHAVRINLTDAGTPSGSHFLGGRYGKGEVGEFVLIEGQTSLLLGRIVEIHVPESHRRLIEDGQSRFVELDAVGTVQLLGSIAMDTLHVTAGVGVYPRLGDRVYAAPHKFVAELPTLMEPQSNPETRVLINIGSIDLATESPVSIRPEKLFGRHCAILGTTGGGKSWTTARIIEECIRYKSKVILIDATGEYRGFSGEHVCHFHLGNPVETANASKPYSLPPTCFVESDFIALFEPAGKIQGPKLRAAIRSLRLVGLCTELASNGLLKKVEQLKAPVLAAEQRPDIAAKLDDPRQAFDVTKLVSQIEQECVWPDGFAASPPAPRGTKDPTRWGPDSGEFAHCLSLASRINGVFASASFDCVFDSTEPPLTDAITDFSKNTNRLMRICVSGIGFEFNAREIVANVIGRHLLNLARSGHFKNRPIIVIVDEAHNFLGRKIGTEDTVAKLDAFELIAKEGRKYGLNICLSTQRPGISPMVCSVRWEHSSFIGLRTIETAKLWNVRVEKSIALLRRSFPI